MIIPSKSELSQAETEELFAIANDFGIEFRPISGHGRTIFAIIGDERSDLLIKRIEGLEFIDKVDRIQEPYKILSKSNKTIKQRKINGKIVGEEFLIFGGQCAVDPENPQLFLETAHACKEAGVDMIRGGVWKPRTSPYSFQGANKSLDVLLQARAETGLGVVTEVMDLEQVKLCVEAKVDCFQIGARNALNYKLLAQVGELTAETNMNVLIKRSIHMGKMEEFILAAEYIAGNGNPNVFLCPRGTLPAVDGYRNYPDECITPLLKEKTWAPVIVDPSHSVGKAKYVPHAAMAAASYGADGCIIESHCQPKRGIGDDPKQSVTPDVLGQLVKNCRELHLKAKAFRESH
jgi:3-deoxy-7-phosphoheptulonate synthase